MAVIQNPDGDWDVVYGDIILASFQTHAEAWRYVDRWDGEPISPSEKRSDYAWSSNRRDR